MTSLPVFLLIAFSVIHYLLKVFFSCFFFLRLFIVIWNLVVVIFWSLLLLFWVQRLVLGNIRGALLSLRICSFDIIGFFDLKVFFNWS